MPSAAQTPQSEGGFPIPFIAPGEGCWTLESSLSLSLSLLFMCIYEWMNINIYYECIHMHLCISKCDNMDVCVEVNICACIWRYM